MEWRVGTCPVWTAYMVVKPVHAPPLLKLRRGSRKRRLKRLLRIVVTVVVAIAVPMLGLLYFGP